jgi:hypothetical protein
VANTPEPTTAPRADDPLVTAPPVTVTIPLTPGWLPPGLTKVGGRAELFGSQQRDVSYMDLTPGTGVVSVDVATSLVRSEVDKYPGEGNTVVDSRDVTIDLNGRSVREYVVVYAVGNRRDCLMVWTERDGLYASVGVTERTAADDQGVTCGAGERIVRELSTEPTVVPRLVTPGLVPRGFRLVAAGSEWETWCPEHLTQADDQQCLMVTRANGRMTAGWLDKAPKSVHGHDAWIATAETLVQVYVQGYLQFTLPRSMKLGNGDLIRLAEAMAPAGGW